MKAYWAQLKPRERLMLMACGGVLLLIFIYLLMIEPVFDKTTELKTSVAKQEQLLHWMQQKSAEAKQLQRTNRSSGNARKQSILGLIDRTAKAGKLGDSMKRVEPDGSNRVRVWLENAAFDDVARWLTKLQNKHGLKVTSVIIDAEENSTGRVSARLVFEGAA